MAVFSQADFAGAAGTNLESLGWTKVTGITGSISTTDAGRARGSSGATKMYYATGVPTSADYYVEADLYVASKVGDAYVVARMATGANTGIYFGYQGTQWTLGRVLAGSYSTTDTEAFSAVVGATYRIRLEVEGTAVRGYADDMDTPVCEGVVADVADAGRAGLFKGTNSDTNTTSYHFDNFEAGTLSEPPPDPDTYVMVGGSLVAVKRRVLVAGALVPPLT